MGSNTRPPRYVKGLGAEAFAEAARRLTLARTPPYECPYCGAPAWLEPGEIGPPIDYCHPGDHGSPEDFED